MSTIIIIGQALNKIQAYAAVDPTDPDPMIATFEGSLEKDLEFILRVFFDVIVNWVKRERLG
jgi:hypothetical protein